MVGAERNRAVTCQGAADQVCVVHDRDAREGEDVALPLRRRGDGGRAADLPVHVLGGRTIDEETTTVALPKIAPLAPTEVPWTCIALQAEATSPVARYMNANRPEPNLFS